MSYRRSSLIRIPWLSRNTRSSSGNIYSNKARLHAASGPAIGPQPLESSCQLLSISDSAILSTRDREGTSSSFSLTTYPLTSRCRLSCLNCSSVITLSRPSNRSNYSVARNFHSTPRRDALPLIPAAAVLLKVNIAAARMFADIDPLQSTSLLTIATAVSRVLISFFPLTTLAQFHISRGVYWLAAESQKPNASAEAEEFHKMWCQDEKGIKMTATIAPDYLRGTIMEDGGLRSTSGHGPVAYPIPLPPYMTRKKYDETDQLAVLKGGNERKAIHYLRRLRFFLPPLPPASVRYYDELAPEQRREVDALRRYWVSLKMFKDRLWITRLFLVGLLLFPMLLLSGVYLAGLERVPLTGRWRLILLTPEEEDAISTSLAGSNWYRSVINLLTTSDHPAPPVVPFDDWRWLWVQGTLRKLEAAVVAECQGQSPPITTPSRISPPPPAHPIKTRPRMSSTLHGALPGGDANSGQEHLELGPPYSFLLMEKDERNAFSYGFGGKGAGGVVVFTGLLDSILSEHLPAPETASPPSSQSFFASIFSPAPIETRRTQTPQPTEEQTLHLACVLAHEMGHLLLSHHLETLSQQQVLWPSVLGFTMDLVRAFIWPLTSFLGPAVNDALANMGKTSTDELVDRYGEVGFQWKHEYEADLAGIRAPIRILALAGYDPYKALSHFSNSVADLHEIQPLDKHEEHESWTGRFFKLWTEATHPSPEMRTQKVKEELERWEEEAKKRV
ncbi:hypothetical protein P7C73_g816, partial [Tremellales sp. Uapishka_1]